MKNLKIVTLITLFSFVFTSCTSSDEPVDAAALAGIVAISGGSGSGSGGTGGGLSGDYWPTALNNQWIYNLNGVAEQPTKFTSIDVVSGLSYFTYLQQLTSPTGGSTTVTSRLRKLNGDYFIKLEDLTISASGAIPASTTTGHIDLFFKDYLPVGGTWTGSYTQTTTYANPIFPVVTSTTNSINTILERDSSITVNGVTYLNVIKFKREDTSTVALGGSTSQTTSTYWFSKNIGMVKQITVSAGTTTNTRELVSYILL